MSEQYTMHGSQPTDQQLLASFRDERSDVAFTVLYQRHAPLVAGVCRQVLRDAHLAQDAASAVFLVLAKKAAPLARDPRPLGAWLHRVATDVARDLHRRERRRRVREQAAGAAAVGQPAAADTPAGDAAELLPRLHFEIERLPEKYRTAIVLHHLEGQSHEAAAALLGLSYNTFAVRVKRGRELLAKRLLAVSGTEPTPEGLQTLLLLPAVALSPELLTTTVNQAVALAAGQTFAGSAATAIMKGYLKMLFWTQVKIWAAVSAAAVLAASAVPLGLAVAHAGGAPAATPTAAAAVPAEAPKAAPAVAAAVAPAAPKAAGMSAEPKVPAGFKATADTRAEPYTKTGWAQEIVHEATGLALVYVPAGEFLMGCPADEKASQYNETRSRVTLTKGFALHQVTLTKGFYLGKYEVTQGQWEAVMGNNPSEFKGRDKPVEMVSWEDCQTFIKKLNTLLSPPNTDHRTPITGSFRLPTEAEWEYACRAGTTGPYAGNLNELGWHSDNSADESSKMTSHPVGQKQPNAWGLFDMHGNVWEWCNDWYGDYPTEAVTDPAGAAAGRDRVFRGGSWGHYPGFCRSAFRLGREPGLRSHNMGCRLAFTPVPGQLGLVVPRAGGAPAAGAVPPEAPKAVPAVAPEQPKVPAGFKTAADTRVEPYTKTGWAQEIVHEATGMALVFVPAGEFLMGSPADEKDHVVTEVQHKVSLTKGFYLGKYEVTQAQWEGVMGDNPSYFKNAGKDAPVERVSWDDCQAFIKKLNAALLPPTSDKQQATSNCRLPTEAEWEYACRAGTTGPYAGNLDELGWYLDNSADQTSRPTPHPVGQKQPNAWGLFDMHGNVWEWCNDWDGEYPPGAVTDPTGPAAGQDRVFRGGSWNIIAGGCRSAIRLGFGPGARSGSLGCRLVFSPVPGQ